MYYHSRELKYVKYGKIWPVWVDDWLDLNYKWLGQFCGYAPQIWLSKGDINMTGFKNKKNKHNKDNILFGFDIIKGFPLSYDPWCFTLNAFTKFYEIDDKLNKGIKDKVSIEQLNKQFEEYLEVCWKDYYSENPEEDCSEPYMKNLDVFKEHLFKEVDQVVVPTLNLKSAKEIICRNEKQKRALRKMGFIEDRIKIKKMKRLDF